jgi:hypothetical protein
MTPIFSRNWLMKTAQVFERCNEPANLRNAWLISRACNPTWLSPISPSISAFGVSAATESMTTDVDRTGPHQHVGDFECLLACVGLRNEQLIDINAERLRIRRVKGMFGVNKCGNTTELLRFSYRMQCETGFPLLSGP